MTAGPKIAHAKALEAEARIEPAPRRSPLPSGWPRRAAWAIGRTGRTGLAGLALLFGAAVFYVSTCLPLRAEVAALRAEAAAKAEKATAPSPGKPPPAPVRLLPARTEMPAMLRQLFEKAAQQGLAVESGKYEIVAGGSGGVVRYRLELPISGPYPRIRSFLDATLVALPAAALDDLAIDRKSIADGTVDAQIRLTIFTGASGAIALPPRPRGAGASRAASLFAPRSWYVAPPPPPPAPEPPPPEPVAPPFPWACIGSFTPAGHEPVYFLASGDRVIDARVGDRIEGVYQFESAAHGELVFVYLPLNVRQTIASAGGTQ